MKAGIHVLNYTWPGGPQRLTQDLARVAQAAEDNGFDKLSVMDHLWRVAHNGPPGHAMLEAYATLGYLAARTTRIRLLALVTAVVYREPGLLAKAVTALDVLSGGRAWLGIGRPAHQPPSLPGRLELHHAHRAAATATAAGNRPGHPEPALPELTGLAPAGMDELIAQLAALRQAR